MNIRKEIKKIQVMIVDNCNMNCTYCYQDFSDSNYDKVMKVSTFKKIIKDFISYYIELNLYGGEPFINKEIINYVFSEEFKITNNIKIISINTNGIFLKKNIINHIDKHKSQFHIDLSIDGNKEIHDYYRKTHKGNGTYDNILNNIQNIKYKDNYTINFCVSPFASDKLYEGVKNLYKLGFKNIKLIFLFEYKWQKKDFSSLIMNLFFIKKFIGILNINIFSFSSLSSTECKDDFKNNYTFLPNGEIIPCPVWISKYKNKFSFINNTKLYTKEDKDNYIDKNIFGNKKILNLINKGPLCENIQGYIFNKNKYIINNILIKIYRK